MTNRAVGIGVWILLALSLAGCCCTQGRTPCSPCGPSASAPGRQVFIDVTTMRIPEARVADLLGALRPAASKEARLLTTEQAQQLEKALRDDPAVHVLQAPKILALEGQEATLSIGETVHVAHTKATTNAEGGLEFSIEEDPDSPLFLGYQLRLVPTPSDDGNTIAFDVHALWREAEKGLSGATMDGTPITYDAILVDSLDVSFEMPNDGHVLVGNPEILEDEKGRHLRISLLHAVVVTESEARKKRLE